MKKLLIPILALALLAACGNTGGKSAKCCAGSDKVLTKAQQEALTPHCVLEILKKGNEKYVSGKLHKRNSPALIADAAGGQSPMAVVLSCLDSRVPVEDIFNRQIGDIFVGRVAGNIVNVDLLGSMEFACAAMGSKLIVVLGHGGCGAVVHAIDDTRLGNITEMLSKIRPAVAEAAEGFSGDATGSNDDFVKKVTDVNVKLMIERIRNESPILKELEGSGAIKIVGGYYNMETGKVDFFECS